MEREKHSHYQQKPLIIMLYVAKTAVTYAGVLRQPGDKFEVSDQDAAKFGWNVENATVAPVVASQPAAAPEAPAPSAPAPETPVADQANAPAPTPEAPAPSADQADAPIGDQNAPGSAAPEGAAGNGDQ